MRRSRTGLGELELARAALRRLELDVEFTAAADEVRMRAQGQARFEELTCCVSAVLEIRELAYLTNRSWRAVIL